MEKNSWARIRENKLLERSIASLGLQLQSTKLTPLIERFYRELEAKGLAFKPPCFLADEWYCPVGIPAIGIPFYLAHSRLRRLEQKFMMEVEGGTTTEFMKLIRHEAGHAYSYAYFLYKRKKWRTLFGSPNQEYPDTYRPRPYSKSYVFHIDNWYAQSHPDEDFAETFAVWLTPNKRWKKKYRGWKALKKLEYVDQLMCQIAGKAPLRQPKFKEREYSGLGLKLKTYFSRKRKLFEESYPDFYDRDLMSLFTSDSELKSEIRAAQYLRTARPHILRSVSFWTKEKKYTVDQLMTNLIERTQELGLYVRQESFGLDFQISSYIATLVNRYLFTGRFKRSK